MTSVVANKIGLDIVDIQISQTGDAETDMFFQEPVLDKKRDYVVGVSELSIPLTSETPLSMTKGNLTDNFLEIRNRVNTNFNPGQPAYALNPGHEALGTIANDVVRFKLSQHSIIAPVDLVKALHVYFETVSNALGLVLYMSTTPSGVLSVWAEPDFWTLHWIRLSRYAQEIIGHPEDGIAFYWNVNGNKSRVWSEQIDPATNNFWEADNAAFIQVHEFRLNYSIYRYLDHRLRVELDADLAIPANILVENGSQKMHYNIASFAIPQKYEARVSVTNMVMDSPITHVSHLYIGNTIMKAKETPTTDWYKLTSAANVQNMRIHVFIVRREWDREKNIWELVRNKLTLQEDQTWFATMKFIQQF